MKLTDYERQLVADFGCFFANTGGNDIVELQSCCTSQLCLLVKLDSLGLLSKPPR